MRDTGLGRGEEQRIQAIDRLVRELESAKDKDELTRKVKRVKAAGMEGPINGSPEVRNAIDHAERRLEDM